MFLQFGKWGLSLFLVAASSSFGQTRMVEPSAPDSARPAAMVILRHLADGDLEAAAKLSNAPKRRLEVLRDYRNFVGEEEFKRIYGRYFAPENRLIAEVAIGRRRLLVWDLAEADQHLAGQFYIEVNGRFVMDDVPSRERSELQKVLQRMRADRKSVPEPGRN